MLPLQIETTSPDETEAVAARFAALLPEGALVALYGDLASGKTCFVRGIASAFSNAEEVSSPTFTLINEYAGARTLYHLDLYRLTSADELADLGVEDVFEGNGVCLVEWAERAGSFLPARRVDIRFAHAGADRRRIEMQDHGVLPEGWQELLVNPLDKRP